MLAISYFRLSVQGVSMGGAYGSLRFESNIFLFDKDGKLVAEGKSYTDPTDIKIAEIAGYAEQLGYAGAGIKMLLNKFYENFPNAKK